jgi:4-aminobutyrate aminotransferase-like enzyme
VAAKATIDLIEEERLMDNAAAMGAHFRAGLEALKEKHATIGDIRGMGLMQGIELVKNRKTREPAPELTSQTLERSRANGLIVGKGGLHGNVVRMSPPLNIGKTDIDAALAILDKSLSESNT